MLYLLYNNAPALSRSNRRCIPYHHDSFFIQKEVCPMTEHNPPGHSPRLPKRRRLRGGLGEYRRSANHGKPWDAKPEAVAQRYCYAALCSFGCMVLWQTIGNGGTQSQRLRRALCICKEAYLLTQVRLIRHSHRATLVRLHARQTIGNGGAQNQRLRGRT